MEIHRKAEALAADGLRVLALARRHVAADHDGLSHDHVRGGLTFLGLQGMIDPPRKEAVAAVASCRRAGIRVKMVTGDHAVTAAAVARRIGLADEGADGIRAVTGRELEDVSDEDLPDLAMATEARTAVVNVVVAVETAYLFCCRSLNHSVFRIGFGTNRFALLGAATMIAAQILLTCAPVMNRLFHSTPLSPDSWLRIAAVAFAAFAAVEFEKWARFGGKRGEGRELE